MISGGICAIYAFVNIVRYALSVDIRPLVGDTPMAFSTAALFVLNGLAVFWVGWFIQSRPDSVERSRRRNGMSNQQMLQLAF